MNKRIKHLGITTIHSFELVCGQWLLDVKAPWHYNHTQFELVCGQWLLDTKALFGEKTN